MEPGRVNQFGALDLTLAPEPDGVGMMALS